MKVIDILQDRHKTQFNIEKMANMVKNYGSFGLALDDGNYAVILKDKSVITPILENQKEEEDVEVRVAILYAYSWEEYKDEIAKDFLNSECVLQKINTKEELENISRKK